MRLPPLAGTAGFAAACAIAAVAAFGQTSSQRTVRDGVFSAAQVERGGRLFDSICMDCHEIDEFTGADADSYLEEMNGKDVWAAFKYISAKMPEDEPGSLEPDEYAAVLGFLLRVYGLPAGDEDLPIDRKSLQRITFARPGS